MLLRVGCFFTKTYGRVLDPGSSVLDPRLPEGVAVRSTLSTAWQGFGKNLDEFIQRNLIPVLA